jgi:hypothetical protein
VRSQKPDCQSILIYWNPDWISRISEKEWPGLWRNGWNLRKDNVPSHNTFSVKQFLASKNTTMLRLILLHVTSFSTDQICAERNLFYVSRRSESKNDGWSSWAVLLIKDPHHCLERLQHCMQLHLNSEWTTLRTITNDFFVLSKWKKS